MSTSRREGLDLLKEHRLELAIAFVLYLSLWLLSKNEPIATLLREFSLKVVIVFLSAGAGLTFAIVRAWPEIRVILALQKSAHEDVRNPVRLLLRSELQDLRTGSTALTSGKGREFTNETIQKFSTACFEANRGHFYIGTDSNVPSAYLKIYPSYLDEHLRSITSTGRRSTNYRMLLTTEALLSLDFDNSYADFFKFYQDHVLRHVKLFQVSPDTAQNEARRYKLETTDLGVFGAGFLAFFTTVRKGTFRISLEALDEHKNQVRNFLQALNRSASEIRIENGRLRFMRPQSDIEDDDQNIQDCLR